ncbi:MAG: glycosyltransferase [Dysosmobacter sp.]
MLNGIDMKLYDPETDPRIAVNFSPRDMTGKDEDKAVLQRMLGLRQEPHTPIVAIVSRLVSHKGLDLICEVLHDMMELPVQLVVLGKGDRKYEEFFHWAAQQHSGRMAVRLDYNEDLSMAIYAGADLFLMPSKSEPCGLSQMIAMRYGTVPIVRETGGLKDTVQPYESWRDSGNGFTFTNYASGDMLYVIREAVYLYKDYPDVFGRLRSGAMQSDFSWARSAREYLEIYSTSPGRHYRPSDLAWWTGSLPRKPLLRSPSPAGERGSGPRRLWRRLLVKKDVDTTERALVAKAVHRTEHASTEGCACRGRGRAGDSPRRPAVKESGCKAKGSAAKKAAAQDGKTSSVQIYISQDGHRLQRKRPPAAE